MASRELPSKSRQIMKLYDKITGFDARINSSGIDKMASSGSSTGSYGKTTALETGEPTQVPSTSIMPMNLAHANKQRWINEEHRSAVPYSKLAWPSAPGEIHGYGYCKNGFATSTVDNLYVSGPIQEPLMSTMPMNHPNKKPRWTYEEHRSTNPNSKIAWPTTPNEIPGHSYGINGGFMTTVNNIYAGGATQVTTSTIQPMKPSEKISTWTNEDHMKLLQGLRAYCFPTTSNIEIADAGRPSHMPSTMPKEPSKEKIRWTDDEHRNFLLGLSKFKWGDWKSFAQQCVRTKTVQQITSHAQKYRLAYYKDFFDPLRKKRSCINSSTLRDDAGNQLPLPVPPLTEALLESLKLEQPQRDQALLYLKRLGDGAAHHHPLGNEEKVPQPDCNFPDPAPSECNTEPLQAENLSDMDVDLLLLQMLEEASKEDIDDA